MESIQIIKHARIPLQEHDHAIVFLVEMQYDSGLPETYQLPVIFGKAEVARLITDNHPQAVICGLKVGEDEGILYDAIYSQEFLQVVVQKMALNQSISLKNSEIEFYGNKLLKKYFQEHPKVVPRMLSGEQSNTSITFDNRFYLKFFRKVDRAINPDLEIVQFLTESAKFKNVPPFVGAVEWKYENAGMVVAMMQEVIESSNDAWSYMLDRLDDFNERILSQEGIACIPELKGSLLEPASYDDIPAEIKILLESPVAERAHLLGVRTGEMHLALASGVDFPNFKPEPYSLHYQRSLFAGLQSLVRSTFNNQSRNLSNLSSEMRREAEEVLSLKDTILEIFRNIYNRKIDVVKIG